MFPPLCGKCVFDTVYESGIIVEWVIYLSKLLLLILSLFLFVLVIFNQIGIDGHDNGKVLIFFLLH